MWYGRDVRPKRSAKGLVRLKRKEGGGGIGSSMLSEGAW